MPYDQVEAPSDAWMQTFTGKQFFPLNPRVEDICIEDIAHALSLQCRFAGHCKVFYSVAEHSYRVSFINPEEDPLWKLLHDATEAYLQDMIRPLKLTPELGDGYRVAEHRLEQAIAQKFGLSLPIPKSVKEADNTLLFTEQRDLMGNRYKWAGSENYTPLAVIYPMTAESAEKLFLERFTELTATFRNLPQPRGER